MTCTDLDTINLVPKVVQVRAMVGSSIALRLVTVWKDGTPFDLTEYAVTAPFADHGSAPPPVAAWSVAIELNAIVLSLLQSETAALAPSGKSATWHWDVWLEHLTLPQRLLLAHGDLGLLTP